MRYIITLIFSVLHLILYAQNSEIKVLDSKTKKPLSFVNVCFESLKTGEKQYTTTNYSGEAENLCADSCKIAISYVGYRTKTDTVLVNSNKVFYLVPDIFNLDQVVVTATKSRKMLKDAPVITQVISSKDISNSGLTNVQDILGQDIPGIELQRGGFGTDMKMQGLDAKNILILVDGERLAGETGYNIDYSRINTSDIERIEVIKGAASALYGSQAMGGVINIITKKSVKKWDLNFENTWSQMNYRDFPGLEKDDDMYFYKKNLDRQNLNVNLSGGFNFKHINGRTDFVAKSFDAYKIFDKEPVVKDYINLDTVIVEDMSPYPTGINGYSDYQIAQKLIFPLNKKFSFSVRGSYYNHNEYDYVPDKVHQRYIDYTFGGKFNYLIDDKVNLTASFNYDNYKKYDFYDVLDDKSLNYNNIFIDPKVTMFAQAGKHQQITGGGEIFSESLFSDVLFSDSLTDKRNTTYTAFIQDDISVTKKLNFIAGGRFDYHNVYGAHFSPKVSGMFKHNNFTFRLNYARGFRSPALKELYIDWQVAWFTIKGNENLKPETNNYISGSIQYVNHFLEISATGYYNNLKDKIDGVWENNQTVYQYVNVSKAEISGVDVIAKINIVNHFLITCAYSYLHDKRPQGELVSSASPHTGNIKINYNLSKKNYVLNASISSVITGAKNFVMSDFVNYRGDYVEGFYPVHFDAYSLWRISVSQYFLNSINLILGVNNLFNYTAKVVSFNTTTSPGRRFFISLRLNIDNLFNLNKTNKN